MSNRQRSLDELISLCLRTTWLQMPCPDSPRAGFLFGFVMMCRKEAQFEPVQVTRNRMRRVSGALSGTSLVNVSHQKASPITSANQVLLFLGGLPKIPE